MSNSGLGGFMLESAAGCLSNASPGRSGSYLEGRREVHRTIAKKSCVIGAISLGIRTHRHP